MTTPSYAFDAAFAALQQTVPHRGYKVTLASQLMPCLTLLQNMANTEETIVRTQNLTAFVWARETDPYTLGDSSYKTLSRCVQNQDGTLPNALVQHPDVIRALLYLAAVTDDSTFINYGGLLQNIAPTAPSLPARGEWFTYCGQTLVGDAWPHLVTLYDLPQENTEKLLEVLRTVPDSCLRPAIPAAGPDVVLPDTLCT